MANKNKNKNKNHSSKFLNALSVNPHGNLWQTRNLMQLQRDYMKENTSSLDKPREDLIRWEYINKEVSYWANFFIFDNKALERAKRTIIWTLFFNQGVGLVYDKNIEEFAVYSLINWDEDIYRRIIRAKGLLARPMIMNQSNEKQTNKNIDFEIDNTVLIKSSSINYGWLYFLEEHIKIYIQNINSNYINRINSRNTKLIISEEINGDKLIELTEIHNSNETLKVINGAVSEKSIDMSVNNQSSEIWKDYSEIDKRYHKMRGLRMNLDQKGDHNIEKELQNSDVEIIAVENERKAVIQEMLYKIKNIYELDIKMTTIIELEEQRDHDLQMELKTALTEGEELESEVEMEKVNVMRENIKKNTKQNEINKNT